MPFDVTEPIAPLPPAPARPPPFGVGTVVGRSFSVWTRNFLPFTGVSLLLSAPLVAWTLWVGPAPEGASLAWQAQLVEVVGGNLIMFLVSGALAYGVLQSLAGRPVRFGEMIGVGFRKLGKLVLVSIGVGLVTFLGLLALVVPGIVALCAFWLAAPAAVAETGTPSEAMSRSRFLTKGHRLTIFLVFVLTLLVAGAAGFAAATLWPLALEGGAAPRAVQAGLAVVDAVASGLLYTAPAVAYHDLRVLKEGADTAQLAAVFD